MRAMTATDATARNGQAPSDGPRPAELARQFARPENARTRGVSSPDATAESIDYVLRTYGDVLRRLAQ